MSESCQECRIGHVQAVTLPYIRPVGAYMLVMPNAPALKCDMCGHVYFDDHFEWSMAHMLEQLARTSRIQAAVPPHFSESGDAWPVAGRGS